LPKIAVKDKSYAKRGVNQNWTPKYSKELLANLKAQKQHQNVRLLTLYTTISHHKLKHRLLDTINNCLFNKNGKGNIHI
jgi:hypothetical protein